MRILYISHSFPIPGAPLSNVGGMQRVAVDLHRALAAHPDVELRSLCLETSWRSTGVRTGPFLFSLLGRVPEMVRSQGTEVLLFSSMVTASVLLALRDRIALARATTAAIPVGRDVTLPNPVYQRMVPSVLSRLDLVLPISQATADEAVRRGARPERVHVVPCGVDFERHEVGPGRADSRVAVLERLRRGLGAVPDDAFLLLSVGRHQERKGFHWFVDEVMPRLPATAVYVVAGSGPMTPAIREAAERRGLTDRVHTLGQVDEDVLRVLYGGADLFVMPNIPVPGDIEGFGVVMLEAAASGLATIAADIEGIRDVITDGVNGWLVPTKDAAAFASRIIAFANDRGGADIGARAARHVRERFGWPSIADRYVTIFRAHRVGQLGAE